jgi:hypothetical protein
MSGFILGSNLAMWRNAALEDQCIQKLLPQLNGRGEVVMAEQIGKKWLI